MLFSREPAGLRRTREVTISLSTNCRIAHFALPLIEKLIADDRNGEAYRCSIAHWYRDQHPPLAYYLGNVSLCRIHGPFQDAAPGYEGVQPLGGLIETPGVTTHLSPLEASALQQRIMEAIEQVIVGWADEHRLYDIRPIDPSFDRHKAGHEAKAMRALRIGNPYEPSPTAHGNKGGTDHA